LKITLKLPNGTKFHYERQPMDDGHFYALCGVAVTAMFFVFLITI